MNGTHRCLESAVESCEKGAGASKSKDSLLNHSALHIIVLQYHIFLQCFHCKVVLCTQLLS